MASFSINPTRIASLEQELMRISQDISRIGNEVGAIHFTMGKNAGFVNRHVMTQRQQTIEDYGEAVRRCGTTLGILREVYQTTEGNISQTNVDANNDIFSVIPSYFGFPENSPFSPLNPNNRFGDIFRGRLPGYPYMVMIPWLFFPMSPFPDPAVFATGALFAGLGAKVLHSMTYDDGSPNKFSRSFAGNSFSRHSSAFGQDIGLEGDYHLGHVEAKGKHGASWEIGKGNAGIESSFKAGFSGADGEISANIGKTKAKLGASAVNASGTGAIGASLFSNKKFAPSIYAKAKGEASVLEGEAYLQHGSDANNIHAKAEGTLLGAEAEAKFGAGRIVDEDNGDVRWGVAGTAKAEAYAAQGKISGGFTFWGIKVDMEGELDAGGAGAKIGGEVSTGAVEGEIGAGLLVGAGAKIKVDWTDFSFPWDVSGGFPWW